MKELIVEGAHKKEHSYWDRISQPKSPETSARWPSHGLLLSPQVKRSPMATQSINTGHLYMLNIPGFYNFLLHSRTTNTPNNFPLLTQRANVPDSFTIADSWWMVSMVGEACCLNTAFLLHIGECTREYYHWVFTIYEKLPSDEIRHLYWVILNKKSVGDNVQEFSEKWAQQTCKNKSNPDFRRICLPKTKLMSEGDGKNLRKYTDIYQIWGREESADFSWAQLALWSLHYKKFWF